MPLFFKVYLLFCGSTLLQGSECALKRRTKSRLLVLEQKVTALTSELALLQMDYQEWKENVSLMQDHGKNQASSEPGEEDAGKNYDDLQEFDDHRFYHHLLAAFKAEKQHRYALEKNLLAKMSRQHTEYLQQVREKESKKADLQQELKIITQRLDEMESQLIQCSNMTSNFETLQTDVEDLYSLSQKFQEALSSQAEKFNQKLLSETETLKNVMHSEHSKLDGTITNVTKQLQTRQVSFSATLVRTVQNLETLETLKFEHVLNNDGNCYNASTGEFTAPVKGVYVFYTHIVGMIFAKENQVDYVRSRPFMGIMLNNRSMVSLLFSEGNDIGNDANLVVLTLEKGDTVKVTKFSFDGQISFFVENTGSTFSGFLLFAQ